MSNDIFLFAMLGVGAAILLVVGGVIFLVVKAAKRPKKPRKEKKEMQSFAPNKKPVPTYQYDDVDFYVFDNVDITELKKGLLVELVPEPDNEYDDKAVAVYCNGNQLGYLFRNNLQRMYHDFYTEGGHVTAELSLITPKIQLKLCYYKK